MTQDPIVAKIRALEAEAVNLEERINELDREYAFGQADDLRYDRDLLLDEAYDLHLELHGEDAAPYLMP